MKILNKKIIQKTKYLNFFATSFLNKENKQDVWYSAERGNQGKTVLIAAIVEGKLVVTKEFRVPVGDYEWGLPAGLVDGDELPVDAAIRELKEETNLDLVSIQETSPYMFNSAGMTNEVVSIIFCHAEGSVNYSGTESEEDIECFLMDKFEIQKLICDKDKKLSAKAYLIFKKFLDHGEW
jgi:ADP-ribose pyrophosphatase